MDISKPAIQFSRRKFADMGKELTPQEVQSIADSALGKIRSALDLRGIPYPQGDRELLLWCGQVGIIPFPEAP